MTSSDHSQIVTYLEALAGDADPRTYLELRYRLEDGESMGQIFERPQRAAGLATRALALARTTDVYFGCAPRVRRAGGRDAVRKAFVLWVDCDDDEAVDALGRFEPAPSIVIASGTGRNRHAYRWPSSIESAAALGPPTTLRAGETRVRARPYCATDRRSARAVVVNVSRLLNVEVPRHGKVRCPFHADDTPSLHVYKTPTRGWYCFGKCRRGGTIYYLAAPLYFSGQSADVLLRGECFIEVRERLLAMFFPGGSG